MKFSAAFLAILSAVVVVEAGVGNAIRRDDGLTSRHSRVARMSPERLARSNSRRCQVRPSANNSNGSNNNNQGNQANVIPNPAPSGGAPPPPATQQQGQTPKTNGLLEVPSSCGPIGATSQVTTVSGPNGHIDWLNCGITDGGWSPPFVKVSDIITVDLATAVQDPNSPFTACTPYVELFETYAGQHGYPPIMLAAFAMQESTCNPNTVGGAGEQGLMQLTADKCGGAPGGNCQDPDYNIRVGAQFFADTLANNNGDLLKSIGEYNGWSVGLTYAAATAAAKTSCCRCQNNLDYLHQYLNGWCQNLNAYSSSLRLGLYFNLDVC
jgi:hypothetical protein